MAALQDFACPTLAQADQALADGQPFTRRAYLGMSAIGALANGRSGISFGGWRPSALMRSR